MYLASVSSSLMANGLSITTLILTGIILFYIIRKIYKSGMSFDEYLAESPESVFKSLSTLSTIGEALSLAIISIQNGMDMFSAVFRFSLIGIIEVIASFFFIKNFSKNIKDKTITVDDISYVRWQDIFFSTLKGMFYFVFAFCMTALIHFAYLEALNIVGSSQRNANWFLSLFYMKQEMNVLLVDASTNMQMNPKDPSSWKLGIIPARMSGSVVFLIYTSTMFNILLWIAVIFNGNLVKVFKLPEKKKEKEGAKSGTKSGTSKNKYFKEKTSENVSLHSYMGFLHSIVGVEEKVFKQFINEYTGLDLVTNVAIKTSITGPDDSKTNLLKLTQSIVENTNHGLNMLYVICEKLATDFDIMMKHKNNIDKFSTDISVEKDKSKSDELSIKMEAERNTLKSILKKVNGTYKQFTTARVTLINTLNILGLKADKSAKNPFEEDYNTFDKL